MECIKFHVSHYHYINTFWFSTPFNWNLLFNHSNEGQTAGFCALCAVQKHVSCALQSSGKCLAPLDFFIHLRCILSINWDSCFFFTCHFNDIIYTFLEFGLWRLVYFKILISLITLLGISQNFKFFRQEDAHEYMVNLLETMHMCCLPSGVPTQSPACEKSLVYNIFGGRLRSQVTIVSSIT